jgi:hypothetical protein
MLNRRRRTFLHWMLSLLVALVAFAPSAYSQTNQTERYCIEGDPNNVGWYWSVDYCTSPAGVCLKAQGGHAGVAATGTCADLCTAFVDSINAAQTGSQDVTAAVDPNDPCCFTITAPNGWVIMSLSVGPAGGPATCVVDAAGCSFNPIIRLSPPPATIPALPPAALAGLVLALLLAGSLLLKSRGQALQA